MKIRYLILALLLVFIPSRSQAWKDIPAGIMMGINKQETDFSTQGLMFKIFTPTFLLGKTTADVAFSYSGQQIRLDHISDNFIFQHRVAINVNIGKQYYLVDDLSLKATIGFGFAKYFHAGNIPDVSITNMSWVYPVAPMEIALEYFPCGIHFILDYHGNIFRQNQIFSGIRYYLAFSYRIKSWR